MTSMLARLILQVIVCISLIVLVLLQANGSGFGKTLGGVGSYHSRKGLEKVVFILTIILAVVFGALSLLNTLA